MSEEAAKRLAKLKAAYDLGALDEDTYRAALNALSPSVNVQADLNGSGAIAQQGSVAAGAGGVAVGGDLNGNVYFGPPPKDKAHSRRIYLDVLARQTCAALNR